MIKMTTGVLIFKKWKKGIEVYFQPFDEARNEIFVYECRHFLGDNVLASLDV